MLDETNPEAVQRRIEELRRMNNPEKVDGAQYQPGLSFEDYRNLGERHAGIFVVNASILKEPTPLHAKFYMDGDSKSSPALSMGDALHKAVLEPDEFNNRFDDHYIIGSTDTWNTKANMKAMEQNPGKVLLTQAQFDKVIHMRDAIYRHHFARRLLGLCDDRELTGICPDKDTGVIRKIRVDGRPSSDQSQFILDIKTSRDLMERAFYYDCLKYGYHLQGAYYIDTDAMISGRKRQQFIILGVTNKAPYYARVYTLPPVLIETGRALYTHRLAKLAQAAKHGLWDAFEHESEPVPLELSND